MLSSPTLASVKSWCWTRCAKNSIPYCSMYGDVCYFTGWQDLQLLWDCRVHGSRSGPSSGSTGTWYGMFWQSFQNQDALLHIIHTDVRSFWYMSEQILFCGDICQNTLRANKMVDIWSRGMETQPPEAIGYKVLKWYSTHFLIQCLVLFNVLRSPGWQKQVTAPT